MEINQSQSDDMGFVNRGQTVQPVVSTHGKGPGPTTPPEPPARSAPLEESDFLLIRKAAVARKAATGAARTALISSTVTLCIGISAVPFVIMSPSWAGVMVAVGLCVIGAVEHWGYRRIRKAEPAAARILGINQLAFLVLIIVYCLSQMLTFSTEAIKTSAISSDVRSQLGAQTDLTRDIDNQIDRVGPLIVYGLYGLVIVLSIFFQGGLALYYFTRRKHLESFHRQTPEWIRRLFIETQA